MSKDKTLQKQSGRLIWMGVETNPDEVTSGLVEESGTFWSISSNSTIFCRGVGRTIAEAYYNMMEDFHQRR